MQKYDYSDWILPAVDSSQRLISRLGGTPFNHSKLLFAFFTYLTGEMVPIKHQAQDLVKNTKHGFKNT